MNKLFLITILGLFVSCEEAGKFRSNSNKCAGEDNVFRECFKSDAFASQKFTKKYIAEVDTSISLGKSQFIINDYNRDIDSDSDFTCELEIDAGKKFRYTMNGSELTLEDGINTLILTKEDDLNPDSLIGSWMLEKNSEYVQEITQLIFLDAHELRIRKTCNVR